MLSGGAAREFQILQRWWSFPRAAFICPPGTSYQYRSCAAGVLFALAHPSPWRGLLPGGLPSLSSWEPRGFLRTGPGSRMVTVSRVHQEQPGASRVWRPWASPSRHGALTDVVVRYVVGPDEGQVLWVAFGLASLHWPALTHLNTAHAGFPFFSNPRPSFGLGHNTCEGGTLPLNTYGAAFQAGGYEWSKEFCNADSDGDGQTNGEELGDPCCEWGRSDLPSPYMESFVPSHPGMAGHKQPASYKRPTCGTAATAPLQKATKMATFMPGEVQKGLKWVINDYELPVRRTTYVNMGWNFNDETADIFHIVYGTAIVDQPKHLHHFVVTGCSERFPENETGIPLTANLSSATQAVRKTCNQQIGGFAGWAPGRDMWESPQDAGVPIGKGVGIVAIEVNIHYTDVLEVGTIARDGIHLHYTPTLRPKTVLSTAVINIPSAHPDLIAIPSGKKRHFLTRRCKIIDRCTDSTSEQLKALIGAQTDLSKVAPPAGAATPLSNGNFQRPAGGATALTCEFIARLGGCDRNKLMEQLCPKSCNKAACPADRDPAMEPPLQIIGSYFHAHLAGVEMYQTLVHDGLQTDLASQPIWHYDDQQVFPLLTQGYNLTTDDILQSTCVYDTTKGVGAKEPLRFGRETVDEMCINTVVTIHSTEEANKLGAVAFMCDGNMWMGDLAPDDLGLSLPVDHPESKSTHVYKVKLASACVHVCMCACA